MLEVETSLNNSIITNPNPNWRSLTVSDELVAANVLPMFPIHSIYDIYCGNESIFLAE